jgi:hypothetical protein
MIWGLEDSTVLGLAGIIAGIGVGLGTALMSFWWNYRIRALPHREFLYEKQIEGYLELSTAMCSLLRPCYEFLWSNDLTLDQNRKKFVDIIDKPQDDLHEQVRKCFAILPIDVGRAVLDLYGKLTDDIPNMSNNKEALKVLTMGELDVYDAVRRLAGVKPLTKDMLQAFGKHT